MCVACEGKRGLGGMQGAAVSAGLRKQTRFASLQDCFNIRKRFLSVAVRGLVQKEGLHATRRTAHAFTVRRRASKEAVMRKALSDAEGGTRHFVILGSLVLIHNCLNRFASTKRNTVLRHLSHLRIT